MLGRRRTFHRPIERRSLRCHLSGGFERLANRRHGVTEAAMPCDGGQPYEWEYQQTETANGQVWVAERVLKHLDPSWPTYFGA